MQENKVHIVIVNYRKWEDALECLLSVLRSDYSNYSVFLVDNHSGNNSLEKIREGLKINSPGETSLTIDEPSFILLGAGELAGHIDSLSKIVFIQNDKNAGFAAGNNTVLKWLCKKDGFIWLLNPDMVIERTALSSLVQYAVQLPPESIVGTVIRSYAPHHKLVTYGGARVNFLAATVKQVREPGLVNGLDYISGGSLFTRSSNLQKLGLLPERYFLYWEETDWCYDAKRKGFGLYVCMNATCYDKGSTSIGKSFVADYYYARNGLLFISRFRPGNIPIVTFFLGVRFLKRVATARWKRAGGIYKGTLDFFKVNADANK